MNAKIAPFATVHALKDFPEGHAKHGVIETRCGRFPNPDALPLVSGTDADVDCRTCRRSIKARQS